MLGKEGTGPMSECWEALVHGTREMDLRGSTSRIHHSHLLWEIPGEDGIGAACGVLAKWLMVHLRAFVTCVSALALWPMVAGCSGDIDATRFGPPGGLLGKGLASSEGDAGSKGGKT